MTCQFTEPLAAIVGRFLGPAPGRRGDRSGRSWWLCPFHQDGNPSLCVEPDGTHFHCFGCGTRGDAIDFVRKLNPSMSFREAKAAIDGGPIPPRKPTLPTPVSRKDLATRPANWQAFARTVVAEAEAAIWSVEGESARAYLNARGLNDSTIRCARLGLQEKERYVSDVFPGKSVWVPHGVTIPWLDGDDVLMINVRRPEGFDPKYIAVRGSRRDGVYPSRRIITLGKPLAIVEGEFESLLLNQELDGLVPTITLGSASDRPKPIVLDSMLRANPWYAAGDSDAAGEKSAQGWLGRSERCRRVRPPGPFKDWTEACQSGVNLCRWWKDRLAGDESPPLFTWEEASRIRWGPGLDDDEPGLDVHPPTPVIELTVEAIGSIEPPTLEPLPFERDAYHIAKAAIVQERLLERGVAFAWDCEPTLEQIRSAQELIGSTATPIIPSPPGPVDPNMLTIQGLMESVATTIRKERQVTPSIDISPGV